MMNTIVFYKNDYNENAEHNQAQDSAYTSARKFMWYDANIVTWFPSLGKT